MIKTPIVLASTFAGLAGVAVFHSTPQKIVLSSLSNTPSAATPAASAAGPTATATTPAASQSPAAPSSAPSVAPTTSATVSSTATRSATGPSVNYYYGLLSVKVTATGTRIDKITIATLSDGGNPYSAYVDHLALPMLQREAMKAQGANIQGVSGASYTSAGFAQSLQGALSQLKLK